MLYYVTQAQLLMHVVDHVPLGIDDHEVNLMNMHCCGWSMEQQREGYSVNEQPRYNRRPSAPSASHKTLIHFIAVLFQVSKCWRWEHYLDFEYQPASHLHLQRRLRYPTQRVICCRAALQVQGSDSNSRFKIQNSRFKTEKFQIHCFRIIQNSRQFALLPVRNLKIWRL